MEFCVFKHDISDFCVEIYFQNFSGACRKKFASVSLIHITLLRLLNFVLNALESALKKSCISVLWRREQVARKSFRRRFIRGIFREIQSLFSLTFFLRIGIHFSISVCTIVLNFSHASCIDVKPRDTKWMNPSKLASGKSNTPTWSALVKSGIDSLSCARFTAYIWNCGNDEHRIRNPFKEFTTEIMCGHGFFRNMDQAVIHQMSARWWGNNDVSKV